MPENQEIMTTRTITCSTKKKNEGGILLQRSSFLVVQVLLSLVAMIQISMISTKVHAFSIRSNSNNNNNIIGNTFVIHQSNQQQQQQSITVVGSVVESRLFSSTFTDDDTTNSNSFYMVEQAKVRLINTALRLKDEYGIFLLEKEAIDQLKISLDTFDSIQKSNTASTSSTTTTNIPSMFAGEWELVVTTGINTDGITIPDVLKNIVNQIGPIKTIRDTIRTNNNKFFKVQQIISSSNDQIDNIIIYDPPNVLQEILSSTSTSISLPEQLVTLNINPLQVSRSKVILQHTAVVDSRSSGIPFNTKLTLSKVIINVAGTSTILDPDGKDLTSIPIPSFLPSNVMDILNPGGEFTTLYMDNTLRISKGKQGFVEQLRIFLKKRNSDTTSTTGTSTVQSVVSNSGIDVDDSIDPEFDSDIISPSDVEVL